MEYVPSVIVKLVPLLLPETLGAVSPVSAVVLQVTLKSVPRLESGCTKMAELDVTAVLLTVHVPPDAFVAHENDPEGAALHEATEGFAAEPAAAHFVVVLTNGVVICVVKAGESRGG